MIRDLTLGQYYPSDSVIHHLDARVKLFATMVFIVSLFLLKSLYAYIPIAVVMTAVIIVAKIPFKYILKGLKPILFLLILTVAFNIFFIDGTVVFRLGFIRVTEEGLIFAAFMAIRLVLLIMGTSLLTFTTTPNQLTDGIEKALGFLRYIKVPIHEIAMMMSIALRFIPILVEEVDKIMKAQSARGADFESGGLLKRIRSMLPIMVPLFFSAFRRADDLTMAMEARCYVCGRARTKMKPLKYKRRDFIAYCGVLLYLGGIIGMRFIG
ncbi:MAG: energy-coupling factor transporter transmembrane component T [Eubacteriales bacterium]|nr:energy-coupling factor transporter transmembrane component T [Eubacteriales bacterium]